MACLFQKMRLGRPIGLSPRVKFLKGLMLVLEQREGVRVTL